MLSKIIRFLWKLVRRALSQSEDKGTDGGNICRQENNLKQERKTCLSMLILISWVCRLPSIRLLSEREWAFRFRKVWNLLTDQKQKKDLSELICSDNYVKKQEADTS
jgi:hypothetical protein